MERTYTTIDKAAWPEGAWQHEPDKIQFTDEETGLPCLIKRHPRSGHLCGYVGVSEGHPAFKQDYDNVRVPNEEGELDWPEVHGGLTYADVCQEGDEAESICHIPEPGEPDHVWWLGFDCAHHGDISPAYAREMIGGYYESYKDVAYVRRECAKLARQLAAAA